MSFEIPLGNCLDVEFAPAVLRLRIRWEMSDLLEKLNPHAAFKQINLLDAKLQLYESIRTVSYLEEKKAWSEFKKKKKVNFNINTAEVFQLHFEIYLLTF